MSAKKGTYYTITKAKKNFTKWVSAIMAQPTNL
jgi:hypothetical protein